jgi:hypothetical protein
LVPPGQESSFFLAQGSPATKGPRVTVARDLGCPAQGSAGPDAPGWSRYGGARVGQKSRRPFAQGSPASRAPLSVLKNPEGLLRRAALPPEPPLSQSPRAGATLRRARLVRTLQCRREMAKPGYHQNLVIACVKPFKT